MKGLAALAAAAFIAAAGVSWFTSKHVIATVERQPLSPSADLPTFKRVWR